MLKSILKIAIVVGVLAIGVSACGRDAPTMSVPVASADPCHGNVWQKLLLGMYDSGAAKKEFHAKKKSKHVAKKKTSHSKHRAQHSHHTTHHSHHSASHPAQAQAHAPMTLHLTGPPNCG